MRVQALRKVGRPPWACCSLVAAVWTLQSNSLIRFNLGVLQGQNYSFIEDGVFFGHKHMALLRVHMRKATWWLLCHSWARVMWAKHTISWENIILPSWCHLHCCSPAWTHSLSKLCIIHEWSRGTSIAPASEKELLGTTQLSQHHMKEEMKYQKWSHKASKMIQLLPCTLSACTEICVCRQLTVLSNAWALVQEKPLSKCYDFQSGRGAKYLI